MLSLALQFVASGLHNSPRSSHLLCIQSPIEWDIYLVASSPGPFSRAWGWGYLFSSSYYFLQTKCYHSAITNQWPKVHERTPRHSHKNQCHCVLKLQMPDEKACSPCSKKTLLTYTLEVKLYTRKIVSRFLTFFLQPLSKCLLQLPQFGQCTDHEQRLVLAG